MSYVGERPGPSFLSGILVKSPRIWSPLDGRGSCAISSKPRRRLVGVGPPQPRSSIGHPLWVLWLLVALGAVLFIVLRAIGASPDPVSKPRRLPPRRGAFGKRAPIIGEILMSRGFPTQAAFVTRVVNLAHPRASHYYLFIDLFICNATSSFPNFSRVVTKVWRAGVSWWCSLKTNTKGKQLTQIIEWA